ncbi:hypothetical protein F5Y09DRAFT_293600 [Xylaria sp. FL1042]|nr:hypothetical protein F5Y09DRAFT_293600 [Xylaria sp. FL1042]
MTVDIPSQPRRYWLLTMPRTASNLLVRVLNLDEQGVRRPAFHGGYFFFPSMIARLQLYNKQTAWSPEDRLKIEEGVKKSFDSLQDHIEAAEENGEKIFVKEHISFLNEAHYEQEVMFGTKAGEDTVPNPIAARGFSQSTRSSLNHTSLPDEFLKTWFPTFLIRHPGMMLPSLYRTAQKVVIYGNRRANDEPYEIETTTQFVRCLYDFYINHFGEDSQWPIVLDADDVIASPEIVRKYAKLVGLDPEKLMFSWEKASQEKIDKLGAPAKVMLSSINASTGVDKGKMAGDMDIDAEAEKWKAEFGEEGGKKLEKWVRAAMPDYEYLHARRLRLD